MLKSSTYLIHITVILILLVATLFLFFGYSVQLDVKTFQRILKKLLGIVLIVASKFRSKPGDFPPETRRISDAMVGRRDAIGGFQFPHLLQ